MKRSSLSVLIISLFFLQTRAQVNTQDSLALVNIYNSTSGASWTQKWIRAQPISTWFGVTVTAGRVTGINLPGNNLAGSLNSTNIAKLTKLKVLNLSHNSIGGSIPAGVGSLTELEQLNLSFNAFTGTTPSGLFNNLQQLTHVNFANNNISGWFPSSVSNATALAEINFANNSMTNKIPTTINNLTLLTKFLVSNNKLFGALPAGKLCSPSVTIDISGNAFTFTGLECLGTNPNATYGDQQGIDLGRSNLTLSVVAAGGTITNNTYTWYRNTSATPYFVASNGTNNRMRAVATGSYWAEVTNSALPGLTLHTDTISLTVNSLATDSLALVDLYNSTNGNNWTNKTNWLTSAPLREWFGVVVYQKRVEDLRLIDNNLVGELPASFKHLDLNELFLRGNKLKGEIPWPSLQRRDYTFYVDLSHNEFTTISADYNIHVNYLNLSNNLLSGIIPANLFNANNVDLRYNNLTFTSLLNLTRTDTAVKLQPQATIPLIRDGLTLKAAAGGNLSNNTYHWYRNRLLVATISGDSSFLAPSSATYHALVTNSKAPNLTLNSDTVDLIDNNSMAQDSLALVEISNHLKFQTHWPFNSPVNTWEGVTVEDGRVKEIYLYLATGTISPAIGNLTAIRSIHIYGDPELGKIITGTLPTTLANLPLIETLSIEMFSDNGGPIPDDIGRNQPYLSWFRLPGNNHTGSIPSGLKYAKGLQVLELPGNQLTGPIPAFFKDLDLSSIHLHDNQLTGSIPDTLSRLDTLIMINLHNNQLTGEIPPWLASRPVLYSVDLAYNKLTGSLPDSMLFKWGVAYVNNNQFSGKLPLMKGTEAWYNLSNNNLDEFPASICEVNFTEDVTFVLENNRLTFTNLECLSPAILARALLNPQQNIKLIREGNTLKAPAGGTVAHNLYKWYRGSTLVASIAGDSTFTPVDLGSYHVRVQNNLVTTLTLTSDTIHIASLRSSESLDSKGRQQTIRNGEVQAYPNPSANAIQITGFTSPRKVQIYDGVGRIVKRWESVLPHQKLDVSSLAKGLYIISIQEASSTKTLIFVKE